MLWDDGTMKICILKIYRYKPSDLICLTNIGIVNILNLNLFKDLFNTQEL